MKKSFSDELDAARATWWADFQDNLKKWIVFCPDAAEVKDLEELATFYGKHISESYEDQFRSGFFLPPAKREQTV